MSAKFSLEDKNWILSMLTQGRKLSEYEQSLLYSTFESETDIDIERIVKEVKKIKWLKKQMLVKLLVFFPEYILTFLILGKKSMAFKLKIAKLYYNFLQDKISYDSFKEEMGKMSKGVTLYG